MRIASYNILTPPYASSHVCEATFLSEAYRLELLKGKLNSEISLRSIICLQEVCLDWAGKLSAFFASAEYAFMVANYGSPGSQVTSSAR